MWTKKIIIIIIKSLALLSSDVQVWDKKKPTMSDYVNIPVGYAISPAQASVTLGSVVCFSSPILTESGEYCIILLSTQMGCLTNVFIGTDYYRY